MRRSSGTQPSTGHSPSATRQTISIVFTLTATAETPRTPCGKAVIDAYTECISRHTTRIMMKVAPTVRASISADGTITATAHASPVNVRVGAKGLGLVKFWPAE